MTLVGLKAGQTIRKGENIFQIENERLDTRDLDRLRSEIDQAQAAIEALEILVQDDAREKTDLTERLEGHLDANKDNLTQRLKEATEQHTKALGSEARALRDFERQKDLARKGLDSKQAWELAQLKWTQALNEKNAWEAVVGRNQAEISANSQGILLDGYSGTSYAQQRMDELDMRSAEARAKLTQEQTRRDALQRELQADETMADKLSRATIFSPSLSLVQSVRVSKGSDAVKGTVLCELVDCDNSYVEASIPERSFDKVRLATGSKGCTFVETKGSIPGIVVLVRGAGAYNASNAERSAAMLTRMTPDSMIVNASINAEDLIKTFGSANQVGRTARIVLARN